MSCTGRRSSAEARLGRFAGLLLTVIALAAGLSACRQDASEDTSVPPELGRRSPAGSASAEPSTSLDGGPDGGPEGTPAREPQLPSEAGRFAPALTQIGPGAYPPSGAGLATVDDCASCHEAIAGQWRASAHAFASFNNPIYRASVDRFRDTREGRQRSRFCAGCHDPALLIDGAMDAPVAADDPRAHAGVTCRSCHGIERSQADGNGSYRLSARGLPLPEFSVARSIAAHRAAMKPVAVDDCGSCHRAFLSEDTGHPHHLAGADELGPWRDSSYAGQRLRLDTPVAERDCADCHMPKETIGEDVHEVAADRRGRVRSHRFLGGHSYLAAMRGDDDALARIEAFLRGVASVDIASVEIGGRRHLLGRDLDAAELEGRAVFELVVRNRAVGHHFPGGTRDAQATWLSLRVVDSAGRLLAELDEGSGEVHRLRAGLVDGEGRLRTAREVEALRAVAFDHTVGPRDAVVVRYAVELPAGADTRGPLRVEARLLHRSRSHELAEVSCREAQTARGRAFVRASEAMLGVRLDPCVEQPVIEVARAELRLGAAASEPGRADHERLWELGLALSHQVQERLPEARAALEAAQAAVASAELTADERRAAEARLLAALGSIVARQGRVDEALELADAVAARAPDHPFADLLRGRALAKVWRWQQALAPLERAFAASPASPKLAGELAVALGSAGRPARALEVAVAGLALRPRDPVLLRAQALALEALGDPRAEAALAAYFAHRKPDDQPHLAAACGQRSPDCARERLPVHVHE